MSSIILNYQRCSGRKCVKWEITARDKTLLWRIHSKEKIEKLICHRSSVFKMVPILGNLQWLLNLITMLCVERDGTDRRRWDRPTIELSEMVYLLDRLKGRFEGRTQIKHFGQLLYFIVCLMTILNAQNHSDTNIFERRIRDILYQDWRFEGRTRIKHFGQLLYFIVC